jgi:hypothetical protein
MIDPLLSLAFALEASPGAYALLLGSGVSRSAGIPTGWEITLDLIRQIADASNEDCGADPEAWFEATFHELATYDRLLDLLCVTSTERMNRLRRYFEPSPDDQEAATKQPTAGHKAIAKLVQDRAIRVIVTTNFDRLVENALEHIGIIPATAYGPDDAEGMLPLAHSGCTVVKVHGDYLSTKLKNTPDELAHYDPRLNRLLDQILDEYGLIVCGWSADYDVALREAISRCPTRRFATYWSNRGVHLPGPHASRLIELRRASIISIQDADTFLTSLDEKVSAIAALQRPHPLTAAVASATAKRYLAQSSDMIRLDELIADETERVFDQIGKTIASSQMPPGESTPWLWRLQRYEALSEPLLATHVAAGAYCSDAQRSPWIRSLTRLANPITNSRFSELDHFNLYPALLAFYAGGLAALSRNQYDYLAAIFLEPFVRAGTQKQPLASVLDVWEVANEDLVRELPPGRYLDLRLNEHVEHYLRDPLRKLLPDDETYAATFDRFEYLRALVELDLTVPPSPREQPGLGNYMTRSGWRIWNMVDQEVSDQQQEWAPFRAGLFQGNLDRYWQAASKLTELQAEKRKAFDHLH